jgi:hypothetical protein
MTHDPNGRWAHARQRVADVLGQRVDAMRDERDAEHYQSFGANWRAVRDHIEALVDEWPPLTSEQRDRLAVLLRPTSERTS